MGDDYSVTVRRADGAAGYHTFGEVGRRAHGNVGASRAMHESTAGVPLIGRPRRRRFVFR